MKSIGIDIGTTSISGVLFDQDTGSVLRSYTENSNAFISVSSEWEKIQSVDRLITLATDILDRLLEEGVVSIGIPVSIAVGDNQASVFSTLASEDDLLLNVGTGSQVSLISKNRSLRKTLKRARILKGNISLWVLLCAEEEPIRF